MSNKISMPVTEWFVSLLKVNKWTNLPGNLLSGLFGENSVIPQHDRREVLEGLTQFYLYRIHRFLYPLGTVPSVHINHTANYIKSMLDDNMYDEVELLINDALYV